MCKCPDCGEEALNILYMGLPMYMCDRCDPETPLVFGFWSWIMTIWFNGTVIAYTGSYWNALWAFLTNNLDD